MSLVLDGLDGSNPLGFLAALGVIVSLHDEGVAVKLGWEERAAWRPRLEGVDTEDELVRHILNDLDSWGAEPALDLSYQKGKRLELDLKAPPEVFRGYLRRMREVGGRSARIAAAFGSDAIPDKQGATKPTAFHFTAGQMRFLAMVHGLRDQLTEHDLHEALSGPWAYERELPVMRWDATADRGYALRATDPSKDKPTGVPGADWLAFLGLRLLPTVPRGDALRTSCVAGGWKTGSLVWPIWSPGLSLDTVAAVLQHVITRVGVDDPSSDAGVRQRLDAWGVSAVFRSRIRRSDQGGYGSFAPADVVW